MIKYTLFTVNTIMLIIIILLTSIAIPTYNYNFYQYEYKKNNTYQIIGVSHEDLKSVTYKIIDYLKAHTNDLTINVSVQGVDREFFNEKEKLHMVDVQNLFVTGIKARIAAGIVFLITLLLGIYKYGRNTLRCYLNFWRLGLSIFIFICLGGALFLLSDFDNNFITFHEIFFNNDLWMLDYSTDLLLNIVPLGFFIDIFKAVAALFCLMSASVVVLSSIFIYKNKKIEG